MSESKKAGVVTHKQLSTAQKIFRIATDMTDVDFPVCADCMDMLFDEYEAMAKREAKESSAHMDFLTQFQQMKTHTQNEAELRFQIGQLEEEEKRLMQQLREIEGDRNAVRQQTESLKLENKKLDVLEEKFFEEYNHFLCEVDQFEEERGALSAKLEHASKFLEKLQKTDVLNDAFHIWFDGHFGTINGFRLGRLPSQSVEWAEINAG